MCFQTKPTGFSENKYFRRKKGFAGNTRYWKQGSKHGPADVDGWAGLTFIGNEERTLVYSTSSRNEANSARSEKARYIGLYNMLTTFNEENLKLFTS